jgi:hypothetical protein
MCEIALAHGVLVWITISPLIEFAAARNYALDRATGRWVLVLDADEVLQAGSAPLVRDLVDRDLNAEYYVARTNRHADPAQTMTDYPLRLFRTGRITGTAEKFTRRLTHRSSRAAGGCSAAISASTTISVSIPRRGANGISPISTFSIAKSKRIPMTPRGWIFLPPSITSSECTIARQTSHDAV